MAHDVPKAEMEDITAGMTAVWRIYLSDYLPADNWTLKYTLKKSGTAAIEISSSQDPDYPSYHKINVAPATTANYAAGQYYYQAYVENSSTSAKHIVENGVIEVHPDFASSATSYDPRSHAQICLDAIESVLEGRATKNQLDVQVGDKQIRYLKHTELLEMRTYYQDLVEAERIEDALNNGERVHNAFYAEFETPQNT